MSRARGAAVIAAPALVGLVLSLIQITDRSLGFDEGATVAIAGQHSSALWSAISHDGGNMAGYYVLMHVLVGLFGNGELVLRLPSAVGAAAATALTTVLARRWFGERVALTAGVLMAVSLSLTFWGQSARSYALLIALSAGSFLAFAALLDDEHPRNAWIAYVLCTALAMYASLMTLLVVLAQLATLVWDRRRVRAVGGALLAIAVCCVPLAILALRRGSGQLFWVARPTFTSVKQVLEALTSAGLEPSFHATSTTFVLMGVTLALVLGAAGAILAARDRGPAALVLSWLVVPVVVALVESLAGQSIFVPRNLLFSLPAVSVLLACVITRPRVPASLAAATVVALVTLRALQLGPAYGVSPENWSAATGYVLNHTERNDCVAFYPQDGRNAFRYYVHRTSHPPRSVLPAVPWFDTHAYIEDYARLTGVPRGCARLWLVSSHEGQPDGPARSRANRARYFALRASLQSDYGSAETTSFGYAAPVTVELFSRP